MNNNYDLNSILNAIAEINSERKKTTSSQTLNNIKKIKKNISVNEDVSPITEKLILEAEKHSAKIKNKLPVLPKIIEDVLILDEEYNDENLDIINLEEIKHIVIDDLYSSLSKKVKKNTLKIIFELRQKIYNLEKKIEFLTVKKIKVDSAENSNNTKLIANEKNININEEHLINNSNSEVDKKYVIDGKNNDLTEDTIKTLQQQNLLIKNFEKNEEKLLFQITDLQQDITLLTNKNKNINITNNTSDSKNENKLKHPLTQIEEEFNFFKKNYEKLIIENNDLKKRLVNTKDQIIVFEKNMKELEAAFKNLNIILSKSSIIKLNDSTIKTSTETISSSKKVDELTESTIKIFDKDSD